jgi:GntR family transcriptional regulator
MKKLPSQNTLYMHIKETLQQEIFDGTYDVNERIPSEKNLCERFDVSRITVRQAIRELVKEGCLYTQQGKGTYVAECDQKKINQPLQTITSFSDTVMKKGYNAGTHFLGNETLIVDFAFSKILQLDVGEQILKVHLIGTADGKPVVSYESYFSLSIGMKIVEEAKRKIQQQEAFSTLDLYEHIKAFTPKYVDQTFEAVGADEKTANLLKVSPGEPLVLITSIVYSAEERPLEYKKAYYHSEKYRFHIKRSIH